MGYIKRNIFIRLFRIILILFVAIEPSCTKEEDPLEPPVIVDIEPKAGVASMNVIIKGSNFSTTQSDNVVKFNGLVCKVVRSQSNEIEVEVPAGGTTGPITLTSQGETITGPIFRYYDIYLVGNENIQGKGVIKVWRNGKVEAITDGTVTSSALSITVSQDNLYISGYIFNGTKTSPAYWKNKVETQLTDEVNGLAMDITINGTDVYVTGSEYNGTNYVGKYWKNNVGTPVTEGIYGSETLNCLTIVNGDVHLAGTEINSNNIAVATHWKNGNKFPLENGEENTVVNSMEVIGSDVFVLGQKYLVNSNISYATYWKNGVAKNLTDGNLYAGASGIAFVGNTGYIIGFEYSSPGVSQSKLWNISNNTSSNVITGNYPTYAVGIVTIGEDIIIGGYSSIDQKDVPYFKINDKIFQITKMGTSVSITGIYAR